MLPRQPQCKKNFTAFYSLYLISSSVIRLVNLFANFSTEFWPFNEFSKKMQKIIYIYTHAFAAQKNNKIIETEK